jgi:hypothetical protein
MDAADKKDGGQCETNTKPAWPKTTCIGGVRSSHELTLTLSPFNYKTLSKLKKGKSIEKS